MMTPSSMGLAIEEVGALSQPFSSTVEQYAPTEGVRRLLEIISSEEETQATRDFALRNLLAQTEVLPKEVALTVTSMYDQLLDSRATLSVRSIVHSLLSDQRLSMAEPPASSSSKHVMRYCLHEWPFLFGSLINFRVSCLLRKVRVLRLDHASEEREVVAVYYTADAPLDEAMEVYIPASLQRDIIFECCLREACIDSVRKNPEAFGEVHFNMSIYFVIKSHI